MGGGLSKQRRLQKRNETFVTLNEIQFPSHIQDEPMENVEEIMKPTGWTLRKNKEGNELIDGRVWMELMRCALVRLFENIGHVNQINVFPISDFDTGSNMFVSLRSGTIAILKTRSDMLGEVLQRFAKGLMTKSRGNSGICLAHFFTNLAKEFQDVSSATVSDFVSKLGNVGKSMCNAIKHPSEGTILSVIRDSIAKLVEKNTQKKFSALSEMLEFWFATIKDELSKTTEQLCANDTHVLKQFSVVDSGAQGFVYIIDGMRSALNARDTLNFESDFLKIESIDLPFVRVKNCFDNDQSVLRTQETKIGYFQYRVELVMAIRKGFLPEHAEKLFSLTMGERVAVCSCGNMVKCHIHTNDPESVFESAQSLALKYDLLQINVEDMHVEIRNAHLLQPDSKRASVQVIYTGITEAPKYLEPSALPWCAHFRSVIYHESYVDNMTIRSSDVANLCRRELLEKGSYSSMGATKRRFKVLIHRAFVQGKKEVLLVLPPSHVSPETLQNAEDAISELPKDLVDRVTIYRSVYVGGVGTDDVATAFEMAGIGKSAREIVDTLLRRRDDAIFCTGFNSVDGLIKSGRMKSNGWARLAKLMNMKVLGYMPTLTEAQSIRALRERSRALGEDITAAISLKKTVRWDGLLEEMVSLIVKKFKKRGIKRGVTIDVFVTTSGVPHLIHRLIQMLTKIYTIRFFDLVEMAPCMVGSAWYPAIYAYVRRVKDGDVTYGRRGEDQRPEDTLKSFNVPDPPPLGI